MGAVIVVGAGIIGLSCAWVLARAGRAVSVFDKSEVAHEASWAGAGMLAPGGEFESDSELVRMALRSLSLYPSFVEELRDETGLTIDLRRCGATEVAVTGTEVIALNRNAELRATLGIRSEPTSHLGHPARFYPDDALVDPRDVTRALLAACRTRGVGVRANEPVIRIAEDGRAVETSVGRYQSDGVLIAAGAWSGDLFPGLPRTRPVRGHLVSFRLPPGLLPSIIRHHGTYVMQRTSGLVIAGSSTENVGFERALDEAVIADIIRRAEALVPELRGRQPVDRWNGFRPGIDAEGPKIGQIAGTAVYTAFGHYRNGILLAPETARIISEIALQ
jgi:glycine oxidase